MSFIQTCQRSETVSDHTLPEKLICKNVAYGNDPSQQMDIYLPAVRDSSTKLIVLLHGGGWAGGDKTEFNEVVAALQQRLPSFGIANINYCLASQRTNHFPTQENDVKQALSFLINNSKEFIFSNDFILLGVSAGANLALLQSYKNSDPVRTKAVISFFGPTNMEEMYNSQSNAYYKSALQLLIGGTPFSKPELFKQVSPLNFLGIQSPPTLIFHGELDHLVPIAHSRKLNTRLKENNVPSELFIYRDEGHGWRGKNLEHSFNKIEAFIKKYVIKSGTY
jgi:acetyl esterase/lipase